MALVPMGVFACLKNDTLFEAEAEAEAEAELPLCN
jgi:hypothetical protein